MNIVHLIDSLGIKKSKKVCHQEWDSYKLQRVKNGVWKDRDHYKVSGRLVNPGKRLFLQFPFASVKTVNSMKNSKGISYARKEMVATGMLLGYDGMLSESQLTQDLHEVVAKHGDHFEEEPMSAEEVDSESNSHT